MNINKWVNRIAFFSTLVWMVVIRLQDGWPEAWDPNTELIALALLSATAIPVFATVLNVFRLVQECRGGSVSRVNRYASRMLLLLIGYAFLFDLIAIWGPDHTTPLVDMDTPYFHEPISREYGLWYFIWVAVGIVSVGVSRCYHKRLPPLVTVVLFSFIFLQMACIVLLGVQLYEHIGRKCVQLAYICLFNFLVYEWRVILKEIKAFPVDEYRSVAYSFPNKWLYNSRNWGWMALLLALPILVVCMLLLCLFGQQPDSLVKAYTQTSDWLLSQQVAPPDLSHSGHYLCTVSLRGHASVVKPLRCGARGGEKIWVNRQLLVANAFEQVLEERVPRVHRVARSLYDRYGYPLSRHINSPLSADMVYVLMKPLEYAFVFVLYLSDVHPESRIARQYLPGCGKRAGKA